MPDSPRTTPPTGTQADAAVVATLMRNRGITEAEAIAEFRRLSDGPLSTLLGPNPASLEERFWAKVEKTDTCWLWVGAADFRGYGCIQKGGGSGVIKAHRLSWILANGEPTAGLQVCHSCDTPRCVNPAHLFLGTPRDNSQDMVRKGRSTRGRRARDPRAVAAYRRTHSLAETAAHFGVGEVTVWRYTRRYVVPS